MHKLANCQQTNPDRPDSHPQTVQTEKLKPISHRGKSGNAIMQLFVNVCRD